MNVIFSSIFPHYDLKYMKHFEPIIIRLTLIFQMTYYIHCIS